MGLTSAESLQSSEEAQLRFSGRLTMESYLFLSSLIHSFHKHPQRNNYTEDPREAGGSLVVCTSNLDQLH